MRLALAALVALLPAVAQKVHEVCAPCHNQHFEDFKTHKHFEKSLSCDACHGASQGHVSAGGNQLPDRVAGPADQPGLCGACHTGQRKSYESGKHGKLVLSGGAKKAPACTTCHGTHSLRKPAAMAQQCGRCHEALPAACKKDPPLAVKMACAGCHDPHTQAARR